MDEFHAAMVFAWLTVLVLALWVAVLPDEERPPTRRP